MGEEDGTDRAYRFWNRVLTVFATEEAGHAEQMLQVMRRVGEVDDRTIIERFLVTRRGYGKHVGKYSRLSG